MTHVPQDVIPTTGGAREPGDGSTWSEVDDSVRLDRIDDFLVETKQFRVALHTIVRTYRRWKPGKDGRLIIVHGPSGSGKTTVADAVLAEVERLEGGAIDVGEAPGPEEDEDSRTADAVADDEAIDGYEPAGRLPRTAGILREGPNGYVRPIVKVFVEPRTRSNRLLRGIVRSLGARPALGASYGELVETLKIQLDGQRTRMIILDEVHHMVDGQGADVIKMLLVQTKIQVVGIGLARAGALVTENQDDDLERHLHALCPMGALECDTSDQSEWRGFLSALSAEMPFDVRPDFAEVGLSIRLHAASDGVVGRLMSLVEIATEIAIDEGLETVDLGALDEAYRQINDVGRLSTPFNAKNFTAESFKPVLEAIKRRNSVRRAAERTNLKRGPNFQRS